MQTSAQRGAEPESKEVQVRLPGLTPGQGTARRRTHGHGYRAQDRAAMQQFAYQQKVAPAVLSGVAVRVPVACTCDFRPYPHVIDERNPDYDRHRRGVPGRRNA